MGLENVPRDGHWPVYDLGGKSVLDIGGGPASLLLKTINPGRRVVIDPCEYPGWVGARYDEVGIEYFRYTGEDYRDPPSQFAEAKFDECWIYNVLQHVKSPKKIIENARKSANTIRLFEWIDMPTSIGHPHSLTFADLREWLGHFKYKGDNWGIVNMTGENDCYGKAFYGTFKT